MTFAHAASASVEFVGSAICAGPLPAATDSAFGTGPLGCIDTGAERVSGVAMGTGPEDEVGAGADTYEGASATGAEFTEAFAVGLAGPRDTGVCGTVGFATGRAPPPPPPDEAAGRAPPPFAIRASRSPRR